MEKLFKAVKTDGAFFFIIAILNLPIILQSFVRNEELLPSAEKFFLYVKYFGCTVTIIFFLTLAINFLMSKRKKAKKILQQAIIGIFSVTFAAEFYYLSKIQEAFRLEMLEIFVENLFTPEVIIGIVVFVTLLVIGVQDLQKIFKAMSAKKIKRITYALIIFSSIGIFFLIEMILAR